MVSILVVAWTRYKQQLQQKPLRTKALTSAFVAGLSDMIAQHILHGRLRSWRRVLALALYGGIYVGPSAHYWQKFLEQLFRGKSDTWTVLRKVVIDQSLYGPFCNIMFMSFMGLVLDGLSISQLKARLSSTYSLVQMKAWKVWTLAALVNYRFVPLQFRVLFVNCVALCWALFLILSGKNSAAAAAGAKKML